MTRLWAIVQAHLDKYGVREAALARRMDTTPQTLNTWKKRGLKTLPAKHLLEALARETGTPYEEVLDAVLADIGYRDPDLDVQVTTGVSFDMPGPSATG